MKKSLLLVFVIALVMLTGTAFAKDITQGTVELGGNTDLSFIAKTDVTKELAGDTKLKTNTFNLQVAPLYYAIDNLGIGLRFKYWTEKEDTDGIKVNDTDWQLAPELAYNISLNDQASIQLLGVLGWNYNQAKFTEGGASEKDNLSGFGWGLGAKAKYFVADPVSLDLGIGYDNVSYKRKSDSIKVKQGAFNVGVGLAVYFK